MKFTRYRLNVWKSVVSIMFDLNSWSHLCPSPFSFYSSFSSLCNFPALASFCVHLVFTVLRWRVNFAVKECTCKIGKCLSGHQKMTEKCCKWPSKDCDILVWLRTINKASKDVKNPCLFCICKLCRGRRVNSFQLGGRPEIQTQTMTPLHLKVSR